MTSIAEAYDPSTRWGRAFGVVDRQNYSPPDYKHRGQDIRKLGPGGAYSVVTDVVSLSAGRVSHQYTAKATGREIVVDTGRKRGRYEIHCHNAYFPGVGLNVTPGRTLSVNATAQQQPGTGWGGPHDHLVISDYPDAAHTPSRPVYDPRDFILAALASAAGGNGKPLPEEDDMFTDDDRLTMNKIREAVADGIPGRDLSKSRIAQIGDAVFNIEDRFFIKNNKGDRAYDLTQLTANEIKPMLLTIIASIGRTAESAAEPIDTAALAAAIREGLGAEVADELARRLKS